MLDGDTGEQHHEHDRHYIFDDQNTRCPFDETRFAQSGFIHRFHHDGRRRHTEHTGKEQGVQAIHLCPFADTETEQHHTADDGQRTDGCHFAGSDEVLDTELQTDTEQHEQHTNVTPSFDVIGTYPRLTEQVRPHQHTGDDVTQHDRLLEQFEYQADNARGNHQNV